MTKLRYNAIPMLAAAVLAVLPARGQLSKEITIDREIVPEVHSATRPDIYPSQLKFTATQRQLQARDYTRISEFGPHIGTLEPASTEPAAPLTPYRGYVDLGYFPAANAGLSAGYTIVGTDATQLSIWGQLNNRQYKSAPLEGMDKETFRQTQGKLGIDLSHKFGTAGRLTVATDVNFLSFKQPWSLIDRSLAKKEAEDAPTGPTEIPSAIGQSALGWNLDALWEGRANNRLTYYIGAAFNIFNFSKGLPTDEDNPATPEIPAVKQTGYGVRLGVADRISDIARVGLDVNADFLHFNSYLQPDAFTETDPDNETFTLPGGKTVGIASIIPYYSLTTGIYRVKIGARIDFTFNSGKKFHIAPDVLLGVNPSDGFGASLRIGGGETLNTMQSLTAYSPYICQAMAYGVSNRPLTADLALRFGPLQGASITLDLGYNAANNWLMPYSLDNMLMFAPTKLRSFKAGATARWTFRRLLALEARFHTVLGNGEKASCPEWRDCARRVLGVGVEVTPIKRLSVNLAYELRMKRSMPVAGGNEYMFSTAEIAAAQMLDEPLCFDLKNVSNLSVGASYRLTDAFTVFARVENALNTRSYLMPLVADQGISGLFGVGYKF